MTIVLAVLLDRLLELAVIALGHLHIGLIVTTAIAVVVRVIPYGVVAVGAARGAYTAAARNLGFVLPLLAWLLYSALWLGIGLYAETEPPATVIPPLSFSSEVLSDLFLVLVVAGWGFARRSGKFWWLGLLVTFALLIALPKVLLPVDMGALNSVAPLSNAWDVLRGFSTSMVLVVGGVICWTLEGLYALRSSGWTGGPEHEGSGGRG